jgi:RNA polymerase sigma-70 factor (ECF subfamily)
MGREPVPPDRATADVNVSAAPDPAPPGTADAAQTDAELTAISRASPESFAILFDRHAVAIHRYVARRMGAAEADDLLGQTFLLAFERRHRYDVSRAGALPWLYGIATNLVHRRRRDEVRQLRAYPAPAPSETRTASRPR